VASNVPSDMPALWRAHHPGALDGRVTAPKDRLAVYHSPGRGYKMVSAALSRLRQLICRRRMGLGVYHRRAFAPRLGLWSQQFRAICLPQGVRIEERRHVMTDSALQRKNMVESQVRPSDISDRRITAAKPNDRLPIWTVRCPSVPAAP
jgi:hypothetical protein